ncbi:Hypothetical protein R9X50_00162500 [Acrodontium crateriforme]|uniref:Uncharacterized protein n=1 Tax=Acrodontium crateriforme TaxID=150365 RepID=A0AAQ3RA79_9PEZI|nr:Hypothetical protein R9X50_00162500 [Acrodontium crateriforme]
MFDENFSFAAPRSPSQDSNNTFSTREPSRSVSPCSPAAPVPPLQFTVSDLAAQFAGQRIQRKAQMRYDSCESYANLDDDAGWELEPVQNNADMQPISRSRTYPQPPHSPSQRQRRQASTLLLCSSTHHRDIAQLVSRMVENNDQCSVTPSNLITPPRAESEEYDSNDETRRTIAPRRASIAIPKRVDYRRSSELKSGGNCVSKSARFRRDRALSIRRSTEAV